MTTSTPSNRPTHPAYRLVRAGGVFLGIAMTSSVVTTSVAQASSGPAPSASAICAKVSTKSVSGIVGYDLPAPTASTIKLKATKKNDEISSVQTACTYGADTLAALPKDVILEYAVTSKRLTAAELKTELSAAQKLNMTIVPYRGLGITAYYYVFTIGETTIRGISGAKGLQEYGAFVYSKTTPESTIADLTRLAEKL